MEEHVVLVDEQNNPIGTAPKAKVHGAATPLHRGFSLFLFNQKGEVLLQQRAKSKKTWPGIWSNSCCGHPAENETSQDAARRRLDYELGLTVNRFMMVIPDYRYRAEKDGVVENEFCPVMVAFSDQTPKPNPAEVEAVRWVDWETFVSTIREHPDDYTPWCVEETIQLDASEDLKRLFSTPWEKRI